MGAMSLCYADIEPPRFARQTEPPLCRQSLRYADSEPPRFARHTEPPLCRQSLRYADRTSAIAVNELPPYSTAFFKSLFLCAMKNFNNFF